MKIKSFIGLTLIIVFNVAVALAQPEEFENQPLVSEFIKVNSLGLPKQKCEFELCTWESEKEADKFFQIFGRLLSKRGSIEVFEKSKFINVTDTKSRVKLVTEFVKILDQQKFGVDGSNSDKINSNSLKIQLQNLQFTTRCGTGNEKVTWQQEQISMLISVVKYFLSRNGSLEVDGREKAITITDNEERIAVIKQLAEMFDKPFLEEEFY